MRDNKGDRKGKGLLIVCLGNEHRGDDAVGLFVARQLRNMGFGDDDVLEAGTDLMGALGRIEEAAPEALLIIDAAQMGLPPGDIRMLSGGDIAGSGLSTHENNLGMFLSYMSEALPKTVVHFLGIQPQNTDMTGEMLLTPDVRRGAMSIVGLVASESGRAGKLTRT